MPLLKPFVIKSPDRSVAEFALWRGIMEGTSMHEQEKKKKQDQKCNLTNTRILFTIQHSNDSN